VIFSGSVTVPKFRGGYKDAKGRWYFKASTHKDPPSGKWTQVTRRGFATAADAAAARDALLQEVAAVPRPKPRRSIPKHWSPEQARHFLALHEGDRLLPVWSFLLGSGIRIGELVFLRWSSIDLDKGLVHVNEFATVLGYDVRRSGGKSREAIRTIDLDPHLVDVLRQQRRLLAQEQLEAEVYEETDFVFTKQTGGAYHPQFLSRLLGRISGELDLPRLTAHGLRHTSATLMLASGVPPKVAAERLGHADATLFSNLYSHVTPTMQKEAAAQIGEALFGD